MATGIACGHSWGWTTIVPCSLEWVEPEQQEVPTTPLRTPVSMAIAPGAWPYPWPVLVYIDLVDEDKGDDQ